NLKLKLGIPCLTNEQVARLTEVAHYVSEVANLVPNPHLPFVGISAFAHKAGLHADGVSKITMAYEHIAPEVIGNHRRFLVSELGGRGNILQKAKEFGLDLGSRSPEVRVVAEKLKQLEHQGFRFEDAEASFELLIRRTQPGYLPPFELLDFFVLVEKRPKDDILSEATVKLRVRGEIIHTAAVGNGPVNALDTATRKGLLPFYPTLGPVRLVDYKVRVLDDKQGTGAWVRVSITSSDGEEMWGTVGSSTNIIEASWFALADSLEYALTRAAARR
ncbi:MAG: citramalate synthase, partial [Chloroflexi bacterium]|nr:citramalate synthase [Chloroflexota bacterium]